VTAANVEQTAKDSPDPELRRLFGKSGSIAGDMGMDPDWAMRAIKAAGNYREIFERNLGVKTPLRLERGLNAQWDKGGLVYAPPFR
jgi:general L-amino acid transport system substrate-binding protein